MFLFQYDVALLLHKVASGERLKNCDDKTIPETDASPSSHILNYNLTTVESNIMLNYVGCSNVHEITNLCMHIYIYIYIYIRIYIFFINLLP